MKEGVNYQIIPADGIAYRKNSPTPRNGSIEIGTRVSSQSVENFIYNPSIITFNQYEVPIESAAPKQPNPDLKTNSQQKATWKHRVTVELITRGSIKLCIRKYLTSA